MRKQRRPSLTRKRLQGLVVLAQQIDRGRLDSRKAKMFTLGDSKRERDEMRTALKWIDEMNAYMNTSGEST